MLYSAKRGLLLPVWGAAEAEAEAEGKVGRTSGIWMDVVGKGKGKGRWRGLGFLVALFPLFLQVRCRRLNE